MHEDEMMKMVARKDGDEDGLQLWKSLTCQTELSPQLCSIKKGVRNVHDSAEKNKIESIFSPLVNFLHFSLLVHESRPYSRVKWTGIEDNFHKWRYKVRQDQVAKLTMMLCWPAKVS